MKSEQQVKDKIKDVKKSFKIMTGTKSVITDSEDVADKAAAMIGYSIGLTILEWVLSDED